MRATLFRTLLWLLSLLTLRQAHALGNLLAPAFRRLSTRSERVIEANLKIYNPSLPNAERQMLGRRNLREICKNFTELGALWRWSKPRVQALVVVEHGLDIYQQALDQGRGVIVAAPHMGAWELIGLHLTSQHPMHFLYQPNKKAHVDEVVLNARERFGGQCYATSVKGLKTLVQALRRGEVIGILPDQEPAEGAGIFADFFGTPAYTMTFITQLARKHKTPVVFAVMQRLADGSGFHLHYLQPGPDLYESDASVAARELNRCVERCVSIAPEQYMWNYKRFRRAPEGANPRYAVAQPQILS